MITIFYMQLMKGFIKIKKKLKNSVTSLYNLNNRDKIKFGSLSY